MDLKTLTLHYSQKLKIILNRSDKLNLAES